MLWEIILQSISVCGWYSELIVTFWNFKPFNICVILIAVKYLKTLDYNIVIF